MICFPLNSKPNLKEWYVKIFNSFSKDVQSLLIKLEEQDTQEREKDLPKEVRLRQIPRETGEYLFNFISLSVKNKPDWTGLEIGGSGGYSTMWQGLALKKNGKGKLVSLEIDEKKIEVAQNNLKSAGLTDYVSLVHTDAKEYIKTNSSFDYVFLDAEKEDYLYYFKNLLNTLPSGTFWLVDNVISHAKDMKDFLYFLEESQKVSYTILTIGKGLAFIEIN